MIKNFIVDFSAKSASTAKNELVKLSTEKDSELIRELNELKGSVVLSEVIKKLETQGLTITQRINLIEEAKIIVEDVPELKMKLDSVIAKNSDLLDFIGSVSLRGRHE